MGKNCKGRNKEKEDEAKRMEGEGMQAWMEWKVRGQGRREGQEMGKKIRGKEEKAKQENRKKGP